MRLRNILLLTVLLTFAPLTIAADQMITGDSFESSVWSLDLYLMWFGIDNNFNQGGVPAGNVVVRELDGARGLHVTGRDSDMHGADMRLQAQYINRLQPGDRVRMTGRVEISDDEENHEASQMRLMRLPGNAIAGEFDIGDDGRFDVTYILTEEDYLLAGFRVNTTCMEDFFLYTFDVIRDNYDFYELPTWDLSAQSLAQAFESYFLMGTIWSRPSQMADPSTVDMFLHHYNAVTASNHHKVSNVLGATPNAWDWTFDTADAIVDWAEANELTMDWHTLLWHNQSRQWLTNNLSTGEPLTRAEAMHNMEYFITTVMTRYSGRIQTWDVVNEAIYMGGRSWHSWPNWRYHARRVGHGLPREDLSQWYDAFANGAEDDECGTDYVFYAFKFARRADPFGILVYNDYNEFAPAKREAIAHMVVDINRRWRYHPEYDGRLLIEGIGMQSAQFLRGWPSNTNYIRQAITRFARTGARVHVTELYLRIHSPGNPIESPLEPEHRDEIFEMQAERYAEIFRIYMEMQEYIDRVTFFTWGDLTTLDGTGNIDYPSFFYTDRQTKPAFYAVLALLDDPELAPRISIPEIVTDYLPIGSLNERFATMIVAQQTNHAPIRWRLASGNLPPGLSLNATTGVIMGTPEAEGVFTFTIAADNALGRGTREFVLAVGEDYAIYALPEAEDEPTEVEEYITATPEPVVYEPIIVVENIADEQPTSDYSMVIMLGVFAAVFGLGLVVIGLKIRSRK